MLDVILIPILEDNYTYVVKSKDKIGLVDVGDADPVIQYLQGHNLNPDFLFTTHHHWDHTNGIEKIKQTYALHHIAAEKDKDRIPLIDQYVQDGDVFEFGEEIVEVIETPGHTLTHIVFYFQNSKILFSGDTLFAMSCGRLFEGTAQNMFNSLQKIKVLPDETKVFCGHEYTLNNAEFSLSVMPESVDIKERYDFIKTMRKNRESTIPSTIGLEKKTNPFMLANNVADFKKYRDLKDNF